MVSTRVPRDCQECHNIVTTERTTRNTTTPIQTDLKKFSTKKIGNVELVIKQNGIPVTLDLVLVMVKYKEDVIGSTWDEHDKSENVA